ncbi:uL30 family ribosomal protein [Candidatus Woesearchaeota archaeon]|nr:uL30 family ribosomal protein [Candidatus Woesearchaeota archaeon]
MSGAVKKPAARIAVVLLKGRVGLHRDVKRTLDLLRLRKKHVCVVLEGTEANLGMVKKCKDAVTWGAITDETYKELVDKRGRRDRDGGFKPWFHLSPPRGGFERKGTKRLYGAGGALGDRKDRIDDLIKRMV